MWGTKLGHLNGTKRRESHWFDSSAPSNRCWCSWQHTSASYDSWTSLEWSLALEARERRFKSYTVDQFCSSAYSLVVLNVGLINQRSEFNSQCAYQVRGRFV